MSFIKITDKHDEMAELGRILYAEKQEIYTARINSIINARIERFMPDAPPEEKENVFFCSVYDYWVYGNDICEEFFYKFAGLTHEQKSDYITYRNRFRYFRYLNKKEDEYYLKNKYAAYLKFGEFFGREVILVEGESDYERFAEFVSRHNEFVVKPVDLSRATNVYKESCDKYAGKRELFNALLGEGRTIRERYVGTDSPALVLEELINQHEAMSAMHPYSVNGIRCTTVRAGGKVHIYYPWMKIGINKEFITGGAVGSLMAGIDPDTGIILTPGINEDAKAFEYHPDTGIKIEGFRIPAWDELVKTVTRLSDMIPSVRYVGWDMVYTVDGWKMMEGNQNGEFLGQLLFGRSVKHEFEELIGWKPEKEFWWM